MSFLKDLFFNDVTVDISSTTITFKTEKKLLVLPLVFYMDPKPRKDVVSGILGVGNPPISGQTEKVSLSDPQALSKFNLSTTDWLFYFFRYALASLQSQLTILRPLVRIKNASNLGSILGESPAKKLQDIVIKAGAREVVMLDVKKVA